MMLLTVPLAWMFVLRKPVSNDSDSGDVPDWPDPQCTLPDAAAWAIARPSRVSSFNVAVYSPFVAHGHRESIDMSDAVRTRGFYEVTGPKHLGLMNKGVLVDVGANIGDWTFFFAVFLRP